MRVGVWLIQPTLRALGEIREVVMTQREGKDRQPAEARTRVVVRWGCDQHRTPAGQDCWWCSRQGELFPRAAATTHRRRRRAR